MKTAIYNLKGEKVDTLELPESVFGLKWNSDLVHEVIGSLLSNRRKGTAHAKDRGEVSGGGRKPWKQKGTGRARHGSIRSPIWIGGGVTHGPLSQKNYGRKINKKAKQKALFTILSRAYADGQMIVADEIFLNEPKTKKAKEALAALARVKGFEELSKKGTKIMVFPKDRKTSLAFRNIAGVKPQEFRNINPLDLLSVKYMLLGREDVLGLSK